eukprot:Blabericola_migrator_1__5572@NODE_2837_length_2297_cov_172_148879_g685_i2_p2_GENE_NODE_2837_length_2297_cov_172_148879_g685_i2NODE_2837_length_2297_cov_172_148879_g685_i2_p2_ORF_typecomplete_len167_score27_04DNA_pol_delta_4/PF04081_13/4_3e16_NODE_2837_length_2297_cov_172_148879_g685_i215682068
MAPPKRRLGQARLQSFFNREPSSPTSDSTVSETPKKRKVSLAQDLEDDPGVSSDVSLTQDVSHTSDVPLPEEIKGLSETGVLTWTTPKDLGSHVGKRSFEIKGEVILKRFDLDPRYGPCRGLSRKARYDRAVKLGLDPPSIIIEILSALPKAFNISTLDQRMSAYT